MKIDFELASLVGEEEMKNKEELWFFGMYKSFNNIIEIPLAVIHFLSRGNYVATTIATIGNMKQANKLLTFRLFHENIQHIDVKYL